MVSDDDFVESVSLVGLIDECMAVGVFKFGAREAFGAAWIEVSQKTRENRREFNVSVYEEGGQLLETFRRSLGQSE
jgi:hypothetical protein